MGTGTNFKVSTVTSNSVAPGTVYGAFPISPRGDYKYIAGVASGNRIVAMNENGRYESGLNINIIYV